MTRNRHHEPPFAPSHMIALLRHFADLRDGTHGGRGPRAGKESLFLRAVELLDQPTRRALDELNHVLLSDTGISASTGAVSLPGGGMHAEWTMSWPEQQHAAIDPITVRAHFGQDFHHPHLGGATTGEWPLNVFSSEDAEAQLPVIRAIITAELHNLVYQRDYRIIPAIMRPQT